MHANPITWQAVMFEGLELTRRLIPAYVLFGSVFCWQCSLCRKLFMKRHTAAVLADRIPPFEVRQEFRAHDCRLQFRTALERLERC